MNVNCYECHEKMDMVDEIEMDNSTIKYFTCPCCRSKATIFNSGHTGIVTMTWVPDNNWGED